MKKDEILQKSRQSNNDEGIEYAENRGRKIGFIAFSILFIFIAIFNLFFGDPRTFYAISPLFWIFMAGEAYGKFCFTKKGVYLITTIAACISSILFTVKFIFITLR
ncbi:MAG: DUF6442 family protein [Clostridium sp.]|uniref:DUF6442 family protein n=1 Tax=Clostridium sp. TaxID=1506 RepID=UPI002671DB55|nr:MULTISPECIES: DUF6442 family protein [Clostridium]MDU1127180.1 DUF6442 family protein [Clostridium sp.]MDU3678304.1 DUF6442 family protein [Clostridium sp.]